jgi:hypothetical protein
MIKNLVFVWIPKTAGTSTFNAMSEKYKMSLFIENYREFKNEGNATFAHLDIISLIKDGIISKEYFSNTKFFTIVRNPYDRFVSLFNDYKKSCRISPSTTLREFAWAMKHFTRKPGLFNVLDHSQCASQNDWIFNGIEILKFENLTVELKEKFNIDSLPHLNKTSVMAWQEYYGKDDSAKLVSELYKDDFLTLDYSLNI